LGGTLPCSLTLIISKLTTINTDISAGFYKHNRYQYAPVPEVVLNNIESNNQRNTKQLLTTKCFSGFETADGSVSVITSGGTSGSYTYQWKKPALM
jgi:hypothetical protein